jgi:hypothetical protein
VIDAAGGKLLVATQNSAKAEKPALFRCNLDGTGCTYRDISAGQGRESGRSPVALIDTANRKLLVVTTQTVPGPSEWGCGFRDPLEIPEPRLSIPTKHYLQAGAVPM